MCENQTNVQGLLLHTLPPRPCSRRKRGRCPGSSWLWRSHLGGWRARARSLGGIRAWKKEGEQSYKYTGSRLYGLRIYGLFGFISVIWSMVNQILVLNFSDIWSFRLYGQLYQDKTVDHISETRCSNFPGNSWSSKNELYSPEESNPLTMTRFNLP